MNREEAIAWAVLRAEAFGRVTSAMDTEKDALCQLTHAEQRVIALREYHDKAKADLVEACKALDAALGLVVT